MKTYITQNISKNRNLYSLFAMRYPVLVHKMHDCKKVKDRQHLFGFLLLFSPISTSLFYAAAIYLSLNQYIHIYIMQSVYYYVLHSNLYLCI